MTHRQVIVTTTINAPTVALKKFAALRDWHLVVVGDLKTPAPYRIEGATYLSPQDQEALYPELSSLLGWNCMQRRNIGFVWAAQQGAVRIATVDDDNIPDDDWGADCVVDREVETNFYATDRVCFDPVGATEYKQLWHRGFPIQLLRERDYSAVSRKTIRADVDAGFWNGDPDIDAICRMEHAPSTRFWAGSFPIASDAIAPFNSQNTILSARMFPDYFLFPGIGRMDDIWGSFWLQSKGHNVVFTKASVYQDRNVHDLTRDFVAEIGGYTRSFEMLHDLRREGPEAIWRYLPEGSRSVYLAYERLLSA